MSTPHLALFEIEEADPVAHTKFNTNMRMLESHSLKQVQDLTLSTPPGSPAEGSVYYVSGTGTGDWLGHDGEIAVYIVGAWYFYGAPLTGERWYSVASGDWAEWNGTTWVMVATSFSSMSATLVASGDLSGDLLDT